MIRKHVFPFSFVVIAGSSGEICAQVAGKPARQAKRLVAVSWIGFLFLLLWLTIFGSERWKKLFIRATQVLRAFSPRCTDYVSEENIMTSVPRALRRIAQVRTKKSSDRRKRP
jgi:hypothetical protein